MRDPLDELNKLSSEHLRELWVLSDEAEESKPKWRRVLDRLLDRVEALLAVVVAFFIILDVIVAVVLRAFGVSSFATTMTMVILPVGLCVILFVLYSCKR